ncbi:MAG: DNA gyrase inhibitor YacG [Planctomycetia bacterium]|nr:DNA gyrase inhibitor YacG [Planctomycetia bacterium]MBL6913908.1 DNA gyrase inhibitor YacG [Planctomycetota bacterium]HCW45155.1 DNA gyrase inhibitor YacG [Planctomycetota bacterium]
MSSSVKCPVCREYLAETSAGATKSYHPFCSSSCRDRDLGGWLQNQYRMGSRPIESDDVEDYSADSNSE